MVERTFEIELPNHPLFEMLDSAQRQRVVRSTEVRDYEPGEMLFRQGESAERFFMMRRGQVKLYRLSPTGHEKIVELFAPPSTFAEAAIFMEQRRYPVNAEAISPTQVYAFSSNVYLDILRESHESCLRLLGSLSRRLKARLNDIDALSLQNATLRVANYLLRLMPKDAKEQALIDLPYSKKNIAARLSLQPETLSRVFHRLSRQGVLDIEGPTVRIKDLEALQQTALDG